MNEPVLVLNANFQPINVTSIYRAINMVLAEKATLILNGRGGHSLCITDLPPALRDSIEANDQKTSSYCQTDTEEIFRRDNYTCQYCGRQLSNLTIDHVIPRHLGGLTVWSNVITACPRCNHLKGGMTPEQSGMYPLKKPKHPPNNAAYLFGKHLKQNWEWKDFLIGW